MAAPPEARAWSSFQVVATTSAASSTTQVLRKGRRVTLTSVSRSVAHREPTRPLPAGWMQVRTLPLRRMARDPYPLQWPEGHPRSTWRSTPKFGTQFTEDREAVFRYLRKRGGSNIVITSNLPLNSKGLPYEAGMIGGSGDTGVAVWWVEKGREQVIACDHWMRAAQNLSAIERTLTALRALDRYGCTQVVERAFAGFAALPGAGETSAGVPMPPAKPPWHEVFGVSHLIKSDICAADELLAIVKARYRDKIKTAHPDAGGSPEIAAALGEALAAAERELGS